VVNFLSLKASLNSKIGGSNDVLALVAV
jgi:hypothetical protein